MKNLLVLDDGKFVGCEYIARKTIPKEAIYFEGHYPGNPLLPGVLQLELAIITARKFLWDIGKGESRLVKVSKYRFFRSVLPGETVTIKVMLKESGELGFTVLVDLHVENEQVSSGVFVMGESTPEQFSRDVLSKSESTNREEYMGVDEIIQILPQRYPFLQVDRVIKLVPGEAITGLKNISASDYMFWGREICSPFPQSIMIEALLQCAGILGLPLVSKSGVPLFGSITNATFTGNVYPGDQLTLEASVVRILSEAGIMSGSIWVNNRLVCDIENLIFAVK